MWNAYHTHNLSSVHVHVHTRVKHFVKLLDDSAKNQQGAVYSAKGSDDGSMRAKAVRLYGNSSFICAGKVLKRFRDQSMGVTTIGADKAVTPLLFSGSNFTIEWPTNVLTTLKPYFYCVTSPAYFGLHALISGKMGPLT